MNKTQNHTDWHQADFIADCVNGAQRWRGIA